MEKLTRLQKEILFGILLGDASLQWNENRTTCRLRYTQKNYAYIMHVYEIFKPFVKTPPSLCKQTEVWYFNTIQSPVFRFYRQQFYGKDEIKRIPRLIHRWLTPRTIAYWFMDDGSAKDRKTSSGVRFCTDCFTKDDVRFLAQKLSQVCNTQTSTYKQRDSLRIYVSGKKGNGKIFGEKLLPYIIPEMLYKVPPKWFN
jgi:hypothetical protein